MPILPHAYRFNVGEVVEASCRTTVDANGPREWKIAKVLARKTGISGNKYQLDFGGGKVLAFSESLIRTTTGSATVPSTPKTWKPKVIPDFPHKCPNCSGPAYISPIYGGKVDCQKKCSPDPFIKAKKITINRLH
jgi:hypothetical protein